MRYDAKDLIHGYQVVDGIDAFYDKRYDKLFIKNTKGQFFLVGKDKAWATKNGRKVIYTLSDDTVAVKPTQSEKNFLRKHFGKDKERKQGVFQEFLHEVGEQLEEVPVAPEPEHDIECVITSYKGWRIVNCTKCSVGVAIDPMADTDSIYCQDCCKELLD
jgi:hypothetical protein